MYKDIVNLLIENKKSVATMESCTGGEIASTITNIPGASEILKFSAVTYSNEYKIKMGVSEDIINKYSVYSMETAIEMAKNISDFANSDYGIGITGKINTPDPANKSGKDDLIFIAIYEKEKNIYYKYEFNSIANLSREDNKKRIVDFIGKNLFEILSKTK